VLNAEDNDMQFSFSYHITEVNGEIKAAELPNKNRAQAKKLLGKLWIRLQGN
jgi:inner membrane protein